MSDLITDEQRKKAIALEQASAKRQALTAKLLISAVLVLAIIIYRYLKLEFKWEEIVLFVLAAVPWFSSFTETLKIGKDGIDFKFLERKVENLESQVNEVRPIAEEAKEIAVANKEQVSDAREIASTAQTAVLHGVGKKPSAAGNSSVNRVTEEGVETKADDPQKGKWGGKRENNGRRITVRVEKIKDEEFFRRVIVRVESTDPANPLKGKVTFHLHPTFDESVYDVEVVKGAAQTRLVAYGAFTVGAEADEGRTLLEYDIAEDGQHSSDPFYRR